MLKAYIEQIIPCAYTILGIESFIIFSMCFRHPKSLSLLDKHVFASCDSLKEVTINCPNLQLIDTYTFNFCPELQSVKITGGLKEIEYDAFSRCENLESVTLPEGLVRIH